MRSFTIGSKVSFGRNVSLIGGDHVLREVGRFMYDVRRKGPKDDLPVAIDDDVWVGAGATILKGMSVARGEVALN